MTNEEAIGILDPDSKTVWKAYDGKDIERCNEACRMAVKALEKLIPKKPVYENLNPAMKCGCPKCGAVFLKYNKYMYYCSNCGQALDWRDEG